MVLITWFGEGTWNYHRAAAASYIPLRHPRGDCPPTLSMELPVAATAAARFCMTCSASCCTVVAGLPGPSNWTAT